jgi:ribonuclease P protein component
MSPEATESFPKSARLRKRPEFLKLSRTGRKIHTPNFIVIFEKNERGESRLGITVSGKVGNAVARNKIKRLVREFFRRHRSALSPDVDVLVIAKKSAIDVPFSLVGSELRGSLGCLERHPKR